MDLLEKEFQESEMETRIENVSVDNCTWTFLYKVVFVQGTYCLMLLPKVSPTSAFNPSNKRRIIELST